MDNLEDRLWNAGVSAADYAGSGEMYQAAILEQYKLYVEMADRISSRRAQTNAFFLSLNSGVVAILGLSGARLGDIPLVVLLVALVILLGQCAAWIMVMRSYRQLNGAKLKVIGALERKLPAFAYSQAEWTSLGEGRDWRKYLPLTHVEQWVPLIFVAAYLVGVTAIVFA